MEVGYTIKANLLISGIVKLLSISTFPHLIQRRMNFKVLLGWAAYVSSKRSSINMKKQLDIFHMVIN